MCVCVNRTQMRKLSDKEGQYQTLANNSMMIILREPISRFHTYIMRVKSSCSLSYTILTKQGKKKKPIYQYFLFVVFVFFCILKKSIDVIIMLPEVFNLKCHDTFRTFK